MTNLEHLYLDNNAISAIEPLAGLDSLQVLDLAHNRVTDLSHLAGLDNLARLIIRGNPLSMKSIRTLIPEFRKRWTRVAWESPRAE